MKEIVKYESYDGVLFDTKEECLIYEEVEKNKDEIYDLMNDEIYLSDPEDQEKVVDFLINLVAKGKIIINKEVK